MTSAVAFLILIFCIPAYTGQIFFSRLFSLQYQGLHILERREYTGCTVSFKTCTNSIRDKKQRKTSIESQTIFYNTHPAIIEQEAFDKVQKICQQRYRRTKTGKSSLFSGMVALIVEQKW